jgi:hypothetical protein
MSVYQIGGNEHADHAQPARASWRPDEAHHGAEARPARPQEISARKEFSRNRADKGSDEDPDETQE